MKPFTKDFLTFAALMTWIGFVVWLAIMGVDQGLEGRATAAWLYLAAAFVLTAIGLAIAAFAESKKQ